MQTLLNVLILSVTEIVYLFGILIVVGFLLGWIESVSNRWAYQAFGKLGIMLTACIGTPIHEVGHALMCLPSISLNHGDYMQDKESTDRVSVKNSIKWDDNDKAMRPDLSRLIFFFTSVMFFYPHARFL